MSRRLRGESVIGLDLSLTRSAMVMIPHDWELGDWAALDFAISGYALEGKDPKQSAQRLARIANEVVGFVRFHDCLHVFQEDLVGGLAVQRGLMLAELAGAVKALLWIELEIASRPVNQSTARKLLLGRLSQKARGVAVADHFRALGVPWEGSDEGDALCIANLGRSLLGMPCMTMPDVR